jgi:hypothetical protein
MSRADKLEAKSERVEKALLTEQRRIIETQDAERQARLDHLTQLRTLLSAANISLGVVPHTVPADKRDIAYDVLDEAYDTIQWNIPLGPRDQKRVLPRGFENGTLKLDR